MDVRDVLTRIEQKARANHGPYIGCDSTTLHEDARSWLAAAMTGDIPDPDPVIARRELVTGGRLFHPVRPRNVPFVMYKLVFPVLIKHEGVGEVAITSDLLPPLEIKPIYMDLHRLEYTEASDRPSGSLTYIKARAFMTRTMNPDGKYKELFERCKPLQKPFFDPTVVGAPLLKISYNYDDKIGEWCKKYMETEEELNDRPGEFHRAMKAAQKYKCPFQPKREDPA